MSRIAFTLCVVFLLSVCSPGLLRKVSHSYPAPSGGGYGYRPSPVVTGIAAGHMYCPCYYNPPPQASYPVPRAIPSVSYHVNRSHSPTYAYQYRKSSSVYGMLLSGLALFNLGAHTFSTPPRYQNKPYHYQPGELCKFGIRKENGDNVETRINCQLISSFVWIEEEKNKSQAAYSDANSTVSVVTTTVTNTTTDAVNNDNPVFNVTTATSSYNTLTNGTVVGVSAALNNETQPNGSVTSRVPITTTTVPDALDPSNDGPPMEVTDAMQCYVVRQTPTSNMRHTIPCRLLLLFASHVSDERPTEQN